MSTALLQLVSQYIKPKSRSQLYLNFNKKFKCPVCHDDGDFCGISLIDSSINCHFSPHENRGIVEIMGERYNVFVNEKGTTYEPILSIKNRHNKTDGQAVALYTVKDEINVENTHQFYSKLIKLLTIKIEHVLFSKRHWNIDDPYHFGFRSNDFKTIGEYIKQLSITTPSSLEGVAGLTKNDFGNYEWRLKSEGILIPSYQKYKISGFQMRNFGFHDYTTITPKSKYYNVGKNDFSLFNITESDGNGLDSVLISDGVKVIAGAQALNCSYALSLNGYMKGDSQEFWEQVALLKEEIVPVKRVFLALDHDKKATTRKKVREEFEKIADQFILMGFEVFFVTWKGEAKGIDDAILAGQNLITTPHESRKIAMNEKVAKQKYTQRFDNHQKTQNSLPTVEEIREQKVLQDPFTRLFFDQKFNTTVINGKPGTGKTTASQIVIKSVILDKKNNSRIAYYTPSLKVAEKYKNNLINRNAELAPFVMVFYGRNKNNCKQFDLCNQVAKKNQNVSKVVCATCPLRHDGCKYFAQIEEAKNKKLILFAHEQMGRIIPDSYKFEGGELITGELGIFTHFIIDESSFNQFKKEYIIDSEMIHDVRVKLENQAELAIEAGDAKSATGYLRMANVLSVFEKELDKLRLNTTSKKKELGVSIPFQTTDAFKGINQNEIVKINDFLKKEVNRDGVFHLTEKTENTENIPLVWLKMFFEALEFIEKHWVYIERYKSPTNEVKYGVKLHIFQEQLVNAIFNKKVLILDGTASEFKWNALKKKTGNRTKFTIQNINVKLDTNIDFVLISGLPLTNAGIKTEGNVKKVDQMFYTVQKLHEGQKIGGMLIKDIKEKISINHPNVLFGHFGLDHKASNAFVDGDTTTKMVIEEMVDRGTDAMVISGYRENLLSLAQEYQMLTGKIVDLSKKKAIKYEDIYTGQYLMKEVSIDDEFNAFVIENGKMNIEQAVQRLRLAIKSEKKRTVYYFGDPAFWPDDFPPFDRVVPFYELNNEESILNGSLGGKGKAKGFKASFMEQIVPILEEKIGETLTNTNVKAFFATMTYKEREAFTKLIKNPHNDNKPINIKTLDKYIANGAFLTNVEEVFNEMVKEEQAISKTSVEEAKKKIFTVENMVKVFQRAFEMALLREEIDKTLEHMESLTIDYKTAINT